MDIPTKETKQSLINNDQQLDTITPSPIDAQTIEVSIKPTQTLSVNERFEVISKSIKKPGCELPCWFGIYPGESSWMDTENVYTRLGINYEKYPQNDGTNLYSSYGIWLINHILEMKIQILESDKISQAFVIESEGYSIESMFKPLWSSYSPDQIMKIYGVPSNIMIQTYKEQIQSTGPLSRDYGLWLFYEQKGFVILYSGKYSNNFNLCPIFSETGNLIDHIIIVSTSSDKGNTLEDLIGVKGGIRSSVYDINKVSNLDVNGFYYMMVKKNRSCFSTFGSYWPK